MAELKHRIRFTPAEAPSILTRFIKRYRQGNAQAVLLYDERQKVFYGTTIKNIVDFVQDFEPWDEVDACIFDKDMDWAVAITHEDKILYWGNIDMTSDK